MLSPITDPSHRWPRIDPHRAPGGVCGDLNVRCVAPEYKRSVRIAVQSVSSRGVRLLCVCILYASLTIHSITTIRFYSYRTVFLFTYIDILLPVWVHCYSLLLLLLEDLIELEVPAWNVGAVDSVLCTHRRCYAGQLCWIFFICVYVYLIWHKLDKSMFYFYVGLQELYLVQDQNHVYNYWHWHLDIIF